MPIPSLPFGLPRPPTGWAQKPAGISLCMIVKNEERFLERCLQSVAGVVDEINIVDTGSTDSTMEIARRFGARIEQHEWRDDFAWARNKALAMATKRWILQLDADEELVAESAGELAAVKSAPAHLTALLVRCLNASDAQNTTGTVSHAIARIFPNHKSIRYRGRVHEFPAVDDAAIAILALGTGIKIVHYGYLDAVVADRDKFARNTRMIEASVAADPEDSYNWYNLGMTAHVGGDQQRAAQALERMWQICTRGSVRLFAGNGLQILSTIYTEHLGDPQKGLAYAQECLKIAPHYANAHFAAGKAYAALSDYDNAQAMFLAAISDAKYIDRQYIVDEDACGWKAFCELAATYTAKGEHGLALEWLDKAHALRPDVRAINVRRAMALEALDRNEEAIKAYEELHDRFRDEQSALMLVNCLLRNDARKAVAVIDREYRSLSADTAGAMLLASAAITQRNEWGDGETQLLAALDITPASVAVLAALEELYRTRSDFSRAHEMAVKAIVQAPRDAAMRYNAAISCVNLNRKEEALAHLHEIDSTAAEIYTRATYLRAVLFRELQRHDDALVALDTLAEFCGPQIDALLLRASILELCGRKADAERTLCDALPLGRRRVAVDLAAFYLREGRAAEAQRIAEEALAS